MSQTTKQVWGQKRNLQYVPTNISWTSSNLYKSSLAQKNKKKNKKALQIAHYKFPLSSATYTNYDAGFFFRLLALLARALHISRLRLETMLLSASFEGTLLLSSLLELLRLLPFNTSFTKNFNLHNVDSLYSQKTKIILEYAKTIHKWKCSWALF